MDSNAAPSSADSATLHPGVPATGVNAARRASRCPVSGTTQWYRAVPDAPSAMCASIRVSAGSSRSAENGWVPICCASVCATIRPSGSTTQPWACASTGERIDAGASTTRCWPRALAFDVYTRRPCDAHRRQGVVRPAACVWAASGRCWRSVSDGGRPSRSASARSHASAAAASSGSRSTSTAATHPCRALSAAAARAAMSAADSCCCCWYASRAPSRTWRDAVAVARPAATSPIATTAARSAHTHIAVVRMGSSSALRRGD